LLQKYLQLEIFGVDFSCPCLQERTRDNSKEAENFRELLNTRSAEYVEEILSPHFGGILHFVKEGEALVEKRQADELKHLESKCFVLLFYVTD
jgi:hypothetical protein